MENIVVSKYVAFKCNCSGTLINQAIKCVDTAKIFITGVCESARFNIAVYKSILIGRVYWDSWIWNCCSWTCYVIH